MTRREIGLLLLLVAVAALIRCIQLGGQSLWIDEFLMIQRASLGEPFRWGDWFVNPQGPLPALFLRLTYALFGRAEWALRLPSAIFGTLTVPAIWLLARRITPRAAWPAAILAAVSPFLVWYSQEARHYALAIFAATWSAIAFLDLVEGEEAHRERAMVHYGVALLVGLMSHLVMSFVALAHGITAFACYRRRFGRWLMAMIPALLLFSPWIWVAVSRNLNLQNIAATGPIPVDDRLRGESTFTWAGIPYTFFVFFAGYSLGPTLAELHDAPHLATVIPALPVVLPLALGAVVLLAAGMRALSHRHGARLLIVLWVTIPLLAVILLSWRNAKVFHPRYVGLAVPGILALCGAGVAGLRGRGRRALAALAFALVFGGAVLSLVGLATNPRYAREDNRGAAAILAREATSDDLVLAQGAPQLLDWYPHGSAPVTVVYEPWVRDPGELEARLDGWVAGRRHVWLFSVRPWLQDPQKRLGAALEHRFGAGENFPLGGVRLVRYTVPG